jgi:hypothetical protein
MSPPAPPSLNEKVAGPMALTVMRAKRLWPSLLLPLLLAGCAQDPFERPATWHLPPDGMGANDANLRTMVVNPNDLVAGQGDDTSVGALSVRPVDQLLAGRRRPLPSVNASDIGASQTQQQPGGQGTPGGAGGPGTQ